MLIYTAASMNAKHLMRQWRETLKKFGVIVNSRWLDFDNSLGLFDYDQDKMFMVAGIQDFNDVELAHEITIYTDIPSTSGGFNFEFGLALGLNKRVNVIGTTKPNVFFHMDFDNIYYFETFADFVGDLVQRIERSKAA